MPFPLPKQYWNSIETQNSENDAFLQLKNYKSLQMIKTRNVI